jgi:hypothetical protein
VEQARQRQFLFANSAIPQSIVFRADRVIE